MPNFLKLEGNYLGFFVVIAVIVGVISLVSYAGIAESNSERRIDQKTVVIDQFSRNITFGIDHNRFLVHPVWHL